MRTLVVALSLAIAAIGFAEEIPFAELELATKGLPGTARGDSYGSRISSDSRYLAFSSSNSGLVPGDWLTGTDIYVRSLASGRTLAVNQGPAGNLMTADATGIYASEGVARVLFSTTARLVSNDTDSREDIYVRDTRTNTTRRLFATSTTLGANQSRRLLEGSEEGNSFIFVCEGQIYYGELNMPEPRLVTRQQDGDKANVPTTEAAVTPNGAFVLFSNSDPEVGAALPFHRRRLYLWNRNSNTNYEIPLPGREPGILQPVRIELDRVIIRTDVRLVPQDEEDTLDLYAIDLNTYAATRLTEDKYGQSFPFPGVNDALGDFVFTTYSSNPAAIIFNYRTGWFELVRPDTIWEAKFGPRADRPVLGTVTRTSDSRFQAGWQVVDSGSWQRGDVGSLPSLPNNETYDAWLSGNGQRVTFYTVANNINPAKNVGYFQLDRSTGVNKYLGNARIIAVSGNGGFAVREGSKSFQRLDLQTMATIDLPPSISDVSLSDDGRYLTFLTDRSLVPADKDSLSDVYVHLIGTTEFRLVSRTASGERLPVTLQAPVLTGDRRTVVFVGRNPSNRAFENVFRNDLSRRAGAIRGESLSQMNKDNFGCRIFVGKDGSHVLVSSTFSTSGSSPGTLVLINPQTGPMLLSNRALAIGLSANGQVAAFHEDNVLFVHRISDGKTFTRNSPRPNPDHRWGFGGISDDGRWLLWQQGSRREFALGLLNLPVAP